MLFAFYYSGGPKMSNISTVLNNLTKDFERWTKQALHVLGHSQNPLPKGKSKIAGSVNYRLYLGMVSNSIKDFRNSIQLHHEELKRLDKEFPGIFNQLTPDYLTQYADVVKGLEQAIKSIKGVAEMYSDSLTEIEKEMPTFRQFFSENEEDVLLWMKKLTLDSLLETLTDIKNLGL